MKTFAVIALTALSLTLPAHAMAQESQYDPRIDRTVYLQAARFPTPEGCRTVGGWEDGSIVALCDTWVPGYPGSQEFFITHGPDADDVWQHYDGPVMDSWLERAYK